MSIANLLEFNSIPIAYTNISSDPAITSYNAILLRNSVIFSFPTFVTTNSSAGGGVATSTTILPPGIIPSFDQFFTINIQNNSGAPPAQTEPGIIAIRSTGYVEIGISLNTDGSLDGFGGDGPGYYAGWMATSVTYSL